MNLRKALSVILLASVSMTAASQEKTAPKFNFGLKAGFASESLYMEEMKVDGNRVDNDYRNSQVGYAFSLFGRRNLGNFYLQSEFTYLRSRSSITFEYTDGEQEKQGTFSVGGSSFQVPLLLGFNIIKQLPYSISLYAGPKIDFPLINYTKTDYSIFQDGDVEEELEKYNLSLALGMDCTVRRLFFDFEYNLGIRPQTETGILMDPAGIHTEPNIMKRRTGVFSFSVGIFL